MESVTGVYWSPTFCYKSWRTNSVEVLIEVQFGVFRSSTKFQTDSDGLELELMTVELSEPVWVLFLKKQPFIYQEHVRAWFWVRITIRKKATPSEWSNLNQTQLSQIVSNSHEVEVIRNTWLLNIHRHEISDGIPRWYQFIIIGVLPESFK